MAALVPEVTQRGLLIVIEGLDRAGKSSQCQRLYDRFKSLGRKVRYVKFPDRTTPTGQLINSYLTNQTQSDDHSIHLLFSANRWESIPSILQDLHEGTTVIIDRYAFSGAVYSAAKLNPLLSLDWAWSPEIGLPKPDVTLFLDVGVEVARQRGGYGEERYEREEMQRRVRELFLEVFDNLDHLGFRHVDAEEELGEVEDVIWETVEGVYERERGVLGKLGRLV